MKIKFIRKHNVYEAGDVIEVTEARAKYWVMVKVAEYADGSQLTKKAPAKKAKAAKPKAVKAKAPAKPKVVKAKVVKAKADKPAVERITKELKTDIENK